MMTPKSDDEGYSARRAVPEHPQIFARWQAESLRVRTEMSCCLDVHYGEAEWQVADIFYPSEVARGCVTFLHGGYWQSMGKSDFSFLAPLFCGMGFNFVVAQYALAPKATLPEIEADVLLFCESSLLLSLIGPNKRHCLCGHSAGAQLAAMVLSKRTSHREREACAFLGISGLYDLRPLVKTEFNHALGLDPKRAARHSPILRQPGPSVQSALFLVGEAETAAFRRQTAMMARAWHGRLAQSSDADVPSANHFTILDCLGTDSATASAIRSLLWKKEMEP